MTSKSGQECRVGALLSTKPPNDDEKPEDEDEKHDVP